MIPEPRPVWMVRRGQRDPVAGTLSLEGGVRFVPSEGAAVHVPAGTLRGARRLRGTPVLAVAHLEDGEPREWFFFFVEPPPLPTESRTRLLSTRGLQRAGNIMALGREGKRLKREIDEWVRAVRALGDA